MPTIIYDVAVSIDGYISGPSGDISRFAHDGPGHGEAAPTLGQHTETILNALR